MLTKSEAAFSSSAILCFSVIFLTFPDLTAFFVLFLSFLFFSGFDGPATAAIVECEWFSVEEVVYQ